MSGQKTAIVFAGGGSLGPIQVGMLRVLLSTGLRPDFVIGSSVGAINAAYFRWSADRGRRDEALANLV
jgi:NTE family protein